jgi:GMP synthase-like glutamine amidotransferase
MRALVIQHDHVSPHGPVGERLMQRLVDVVEHLVVPEESFAEPGVTTRFPDLADFDLVVPMGAPWPVYDDALIGSWVAPETELLREADREGVPVLGICFGGQLLARAHGGSVARAPEPELGWVSVESDDPDLVPRGPWFQWHYDRWTLPPGATEVARTSAASQAFALRRNLAVQFHPELTAGMLHGWLGNGGAEQLRGRGLDPERMYADTVAEEPAAVARAHALVDAFLDRFVLT